jgi:hypothetical protein
VAVTMRTEAQRKAAGAGSTVRLQLTRLRALDSAATRREAGGQLTSIAVLSAETLILSHFPTRPLSLLTHTGDDFAVRGDVKTAGLVGALRALPARSDSARDFAMGIAYDPVRRRVFAAEGVTGRVTVHDVDSGRLVAELRPSAKAGTWGSAGGIALIDDVLLVTDYPGGCVHFFAIDSIPQLKD